MKGYTTPARSQEGCWQRPCRRGALTLANTARMMLVRRQTAARLPVPECTRQGRARSLVCVRRHWPVLWRQRVGDDQHDNGADPRISECVAGAIDHSSRADSHGHRRGHGPERKAAGAQRGVTVLRVPINRHGQSRWHRCRAGSSTPTDCGGPSLLQVPAQQDTQLPRGCREACGATLRFRLICA